MGAGLKLTHCSIYSRSLTGINALCKGDKHLINIPVVLDQLFQFLGLTFMSRNKHAVTEIFDWVLEGINILV